MATCRDCIYQKMCKAIDAIGEFQEGAECCNNFKDRSRFVKLPCKPGDVIFCTTMGKIYKGIVGRIELDDEGIAITTTEGNCFDSSICYHTQEAAEQALKERET